MHQRRTRQFAEVVIHTVRAELSTGWRTRAELAEVALVATNKITWAIEFLAQTHVVFCQHRRPGLRAYRIYPEARSVRTDEDSGAPVNDGNPPTSSRTASTD